MLWQVLLQWQRRQRKALLPHKLTHVQFVLLAGIAWLESPSDCVTQARLAHHAKTDPMMTSQVVRTLEGRGLVERHQHPTDTRARALRATPEGKALAADALKVVEEVDREFFSVLGSDVSQFHSLLSRLLREEG